MWPFTDTSKAVADRLDWIDYRLGIITNRRGKIMASFDDVKAAQAVTDSKIAAVAADVQELLAKIAAIPPAGMTAEQQAALDDIAAHAAAINDSLSAVDALNPPAA